MQDGTREDYELLEIYERDYVRELPGAHSAPRSKQL